MNIRYYYLPLLLASVSNAAFCQSDPTPRRGIEPQDNAKILHIKSQRWNNYEADKAIASQTIYQSAGTTKGCVTNVGAAPTPEPRAGGSSGRYGPQPKSAPVVVTGSVFNICK
jgi:hypothetical protein